MTDTDRLTVLAAAAHGEPIVMHPGEFRELVSGIRELIAQRDRLVDDNRELREAAGAFLDEFEAAAAGDIPLDGHYQRQALARLRAALHPGDGA